MHHEPSGLLSDADGSPDLVGTDTVPTIRKHPHRDNPFFKSDRRILKDGSDFGRELPLRMDAFALPLALILEEHDISTLASWTTHSIRPTEVNHAVKSIVRIRVKNHGILKSARILMFPQ